MFNAKGAMQEFGFPDKIASAPAAGPVMVIGQVRGTIIGLLVFLFYSRNQLALVDTVMAVTGAYAGLADSYVVWKEGNPRQVLFRLVSSGLVTLAGRQVETDSSSLPNCCGYDARGRPWNTQ